jgi:hypothetical protein
MSYALKPCPPPGRGCHRWLYYAVSELRRKRVPPTEVEAIVEPRMTRDPQCNEIANTIANVYGDAGGKTCGRLSRFGKADAGKMEGAAHEYRDISMGTWMDLSDQVGSQAEILRWAFKSDELICTGAVCDGRWNIVVLTLDQTVAAGPNRQFIVPSPFTSRQGARKDGRPTNKSDSQVKFRRFLWSSSTWVDLGD